MDDCISGVLVVGISAVENPVFVLRDTILSAKVANSGALVPASTASLEVEEQLICRSRPNLEGKVRARGENAASASARENDSGG